MIEALSGKKSFADISPQEAKERLSAGRNVILLDVRSPEEHREIRIPKSISLPLDQLKSGITKITGGDRKAEIIVYCLSGVRSAAACRQLAALGYANVSNMGGMQSWRYETERG